MRRLDFALLCGLTLLPLPAHAQGSVTLTVCNTGTVAIDVFVSAAGTPVRPATCVAVAQAAGAAQPAYVGIAFTDSRGQWGAARRFDEVPSMGVKDLPAATRLAMRVRGESVPTPPNVLSLATRTQTVQRGNASVSLPMQLLFQPRVPECIPTGTTVPDEFRRIYVGRTFCEDLGYTLKVEAYPDSREVRLASLPISGVISGPPYRVSEKTVLSFADEEAARKAREAPEPLNWSDLLPALRRIAGRERLSNGEPLALPRYIMVRGTVAAVEVRQSPVLSRHVGLDPRGTIPVAEINFRESPLSSGGQYPEFNVCTERLDILTEQFGADFRTAMVGKAFEVRGLASDFNSLCWGQLGEIQLYLARQIRAAPSPQFAAGTRVWTPPPPAKPPASPAELAARKAAADEYTRRNDACTAQALKVFNYQNDRTLFGAYSRAVVDCVENGTVPTAPAATPAPAAVVRPPVTPAPTAVLPTPGSRLAVTPTARAGALPIASITAQWVGRPVVATGTVARVETIRGSAHVYFEGAAEKYVLCIREGMPMQPPSELVGKTLEMTVRIGPECMDRRVTIGATELRQPTQLRVVDDSRAR